MAWGKSKDEGGGKSGTSGRNTDKRGNTGGGSSTGRSGTKRGGKDYTVDHEHTEDQGTLTCPTCGGAGEVDRPLSEADEDGNFSGGHRKKCVRCDGTGKVNNK